MIIQIFNPIGIFVQYKNNSCEPNQIYAAVINTLCEEYDAGIYFKMECNETLFTYGFCSMQTALKIEMLLRA